MGTWIVGFIISTFWKYETIYSIYVDSGVWVTKIIDNNHENAPRYENVTKHAHKSFVLHFQWNHQKHFACCAMFPCILSLYSMWLASFSIILACTIRNYIDYICIDWILIITVILCSVPYSHFHTRYAFFNKNIICHSLHT